MATEQQTKQKVKTKKKFPGFYTEVNPFFYISMQHLLSSSHDDNGG